MFLPLEPAPGESRRAHDGPLIPSFVHQNSSQDHEPRSPETVCSGQTCPIVWTDSREEGPAAFLDLSGWPCQRPQGTIDGGEMTDQGAGAAVAAEPLVSVVIAVYNGQDLVGQAISSVLRQTHSNIEVFVVDDGSTDHTPEVLAGYEAVDRPGRRVRVLRQENAGCGAARNRALEQVRGEFVTFLDADDELLPHHLETMLRRYRQLREEPGRERTVVYTNAWQCTPSGINAERVVYREAMPAPDEQRSVILEYNIGHLFGLFPREFFREVGVFDPEQVFGACVETGTAVEINSRPERVDPPDDLLAVAVEIGCLVAVDSDDPDRVVAARRARALVNKPASTQG